MYKLQKSALRKTAIVTAAAFIVAGVSITANLLMGATLFARVAAEENAAKAAVQVDFYRYEVIVPVEIKVEVEVEVVRYVPYRYYVVEYAIQPFMELLGDDFRLTSYCPCRTCSGQWALNRVRSTWGREVVETASGAFAVEGVTVAVDPSVIPLGSKLYIEGFGVRVAQDTGVGWVIGNHIDIFFKEHPTWDNGDGNLFNLFNRRVWLIHEGTGWYD